MSSRSEELFREMQRYVPGGVNSPARAGVSVELDPIFMERGEGSNIYDADGNRYIDYVGSWGPLIFGHAHPKVLEAVEESARRGTSFGTNTEIELKFARLIVETIPSVEQIRMVNSGTEATMSALRLARGVTRKDKLIKFEGCYHGHGDSFLISAGSGLMTLGIPGSPGVTEAAASNTLTAVFNDIESVKRLIAAHRGEIAALILEPVMGNAGLIPPAPGFLEDLRALTEEEGILLVFDEVISGFRASLAGAQGLYGIRPDLTCLGKIIGGGFPVGAFGGKREIMEHLAPSGDVYQAGTLSGNPVAMAAGYKTLSMLKENEVAVYSRLEAKGARLEEGMRKNLRDLGLPYTVNRVGSMLCLFFTEGPVASYREAKGADTGKFAVYFKEMIRRGVYIAPSQFETGFVSYAHSDEDIENTLNAQYESLKAVRQMGEG
ncbi:MAG: glutamate-1-semialdehyde 2,1-aminomutase [Spirochaetia bacterium]